MSFNNLNEDSQTIKQPKGLKIKLRPHQLTSIAAMVELEKQGHVIIDNPDIGSGLYRTVRNIIYDTNEFTNSTFIIETNSAILADKVGSGKSYMVLGLILHSETPPMHNRFVIGNNHYSVKMITYKETIPVNLIVVPHNLGLQWSEFATNSKLKCLTLNSKKDFDVLFNISYVTTQKVVKADSYTYYVKTKKNISESKIDTHLKKKSGSKTSKLNKPSKHTRKVKKDCFKKYTLDPTKLEDVLKNYQVIILNVNRYPIFRQIFRSIRWSRVIIDEMDSANIPSTFDEFGNFNWFLTATPTAIFYKSCRKYVNRIFGHSQNILEYFVVKNTDDYVDKSIVLPKPHAFIINTMLHRVVSAIQDMIPQDVMNLINAGNMKEAILKLNCNADTEDNIARVLTDQTRTELHNLKKELKFVEQMIVADQDAHQKRIDKLKTEINRCKVKIETVKERLDSIKDECCFICCEPFDNPAILECCKNIFCLKCLLCSLKTCNDKCPYCRKVIKSNKDYHVIGSKNKKIKTKKEKFDNSTKFSSLDKADVLEHVLKYLSKKVDKPRILIFSDYPQTFDKITQNIAKAGLSYELLSGIPTHICNIIEKFKNSELNILMLDSKHYGSGLNLQCADYIIFYHRMNPELETQVFGRAQRDGRDTNLKAIYLVNSNETGTVTSTDIVNTINSVDQLDMLTNSIDDDIVNTDKKKSKSKKLRSKSGSKSGSKTGSKSGSKKTVKKNKLPDISGSK